MVVLWGGAFSYERGTPVEGSEVAHIRRGLDLEDRVGRGFDPEERVRRRGREISDELNYTLTMQRRFGVWSEPPTPKVLYMD